MYYLKRLIKKYRKWILVTTVGLIFGMVCVWKADGIYKLVTEIKATARRNMEYQSMHKQVVEVDEQMPLDDEEDAWYTKYHFISHAGGGIAGRTYTNSLEAWENSYKMGNRVFDADLAFTSDGELVLRHEWNDNLEQDESSMRESNLIVSRNGYTEHKIATNENVGYQEFMDKKIFYLYTPMSCENMIEYMAEHNDLYVSCDMKDDMNQSYQYLVDKAIELSKEEILDRIIVNVYDFDSYNVVMKIYPFKNVTMREYFWCPINYYEIIDFCLKNNIHVVNLSSCYIEDEGVQLLRSKGIHVYVAIADYISDMKDYHMLGADGAVTNWLYESNWQYITE